MTSAQQPVEDPAAMWNGPGGHAWVESRDLIDRVLQPFEDLLVDRVRALAPRRVLDVGCGTGATTLAMARALGTQGRCTGVDISAPMIEDARARAEREAVQADFICADAQTHTFEPASFDTFASRFGVIFFNDFVRAFANLRAAARPGAELALIAWRSAAENPFMTAAERAAAPLLPALPPRRADEPGQFAFADERFVRRILEESGWAQVDIRPIDVACGFEEKDLERYFTRFGPVGRVLVDADEQTRAKVVEAVRAGFEPFVRGAEVRFDAACWLVGGRAKA